MSYENAPATKMLATHCAVCARPLVDAVSVETGIGPDCRKKYGFNEEVDEAARAEANKLVYAIAAEQTGIKAAEAAAKLVTLGFAKLATKILNRIVDITIAPVEGGFSVRFPYSDAAVFGIKAVSGRRWDKETKSWFVPNASKAALWKFLNQCFAGATAAGPKGIFTIEAAGKVAIPVKPTAPASAAAPVATTVRRAVRGLAAKTQAEIDADDAAMDEAHQEADRKDALEAARSKFLRDNRTNLAVAAHWGR